jgi:branched-subunit amino acid aminotransferase/4-amino-4-deoxychorismate lyase
MRPDQTQMAETWPADINGRSASADARAVISWGNYGHFTAMQVRDGRTRGLDLHLARLDAANRELFGIGLDGELVCDRIRHALGDIRDASVRVRAYGADLMVLVEPPVELPAKEHRMRSVAYQRPVPHLKHSGGFAQRYYVDMVKSQGFDEGLLLDPSGVISEGAITNVGWWTGSTVVWPNAPALAGVTMRVIRRELTARGIEQHDQRVRITDVPSFASMFLCNSWGVAPVGRVDETDLPIAYEFMKVLTTAYDEARQQQI